VQIQNIDSADEYVPKLSLWLSPAINIFMRWLNSSVYNIDKSGNLVKRLYFILANNLRVCVLILY
jgi:hypothetical protein